MVKNTTGGKHHKKQKRALEGADEIRNFPWADNVMTFFGKVSTLYGGNMLEVMIHDKPYKCRIPGTFRKKVWIGKGDLVLVHHDTDCNVHEVMYVYKVAEVNAIKSTGIWADNGVEMEDNDIAFEEDVDIATI